MNNIPPTLRDDLARDPYYKHCARSDEDCEGRITWEHAFLYGNKQIQRKWAIIPLCEFHHLGAGLKKFINQCIAAARATPADRKEFPKINWAMYDRCKRK